VLVSFDALNRVLTEGEVRGRVWIHENARSATSQVRAPLPEEIFELHRVMFGSVFDWAGTPRTADHGPGGIVHVRWPHVREELHKLAGDAAAWVSSMACSDVRAIAGVVADFHHRFQWIHPFPDTNGRTGRVLDLLLLWRTFSLAGEALETSPMLEYFPDDEHEIEYYDGLTEADNHRSSRLRTYYEERIASAMEALPT
jgi:fido (protein-threonine AMPylation protein)